MEDQPVEIVLSRGTTGLGFNIRGGIDIPQVPGDTGIFVAKLKEDGAAVRDGRLKVGDKILSVNGKSLKGVTHKEAVEAFIASGDKVVLQVLPGAETKIKNAAQVQRSKERIAKKDDAEASGGSGSKVIIVLGVIALAAAVGVGVYLRVKRR